MIADAQISPCGRYRYLLSRTWDEAMPACFVMLNPSTADAAQNDPTIESCIRIAKNAKAGGIVVVNLYAFRATDPKDLKRAGYPIGPDNNGYILGAVERGLPVIAAWGNNATGERVWQVKQLMKKACRSIFCLGLTKSGQPKHPLYVPAAQALIPFPL